MTAAEVLEVITRCIKDAVVPELTLMDPFVQRAYEEYYHDKQTCEFKGKEGPCRPFSKDPGFRRIDALIVRGDQRTAVEIKVSHSDFLRETDAKRRPWLPIVHRFVYVCPANVIQPHEVPQGCGLQWVVEDAYGRGPKFRTLETKKRAVINKNPDPIPNQLFVSLCYRASRIPLESIPDSMYQQEQNMEAERIPRSCKVCGAEEDSQGDISHGKGCFVVSPDGGGYE